MTPLNAPAAAPIPEAFHNSPSSSSRPLTLAAAAVAHADCSLRYRQDNHSKRATGDHPRDHGGHSATHRARRRRGWYPAETRRRHAQWRRGPSCTPPLGWTSASKGAIGTIEMGEERLWRWTRRSALCRLLVGPYSIKLEPGHPALRVCLIEILKRLGRTGDGKDCANFLGYLKQRFMCHD
jgi:hypothetical protein